MCNVLSMPDDLTLRQARELLSTWAVDAAAVLARRDPAIRAAIAAGVSQSEAHRLSGLSRNTIHGILTGDAA
jgi:hypothetical protein